MTKSNIDKWLAGCLLATVALFPIDMHIYNIPLDAMEPRIKVAIASVLIGLMYMRQHKILTQDEITSVVHPACLLLHSFTLHEDINISTRTMINMAAISLIHSFLPTWKPHLDLFYACALPVTRVLLFSLEDDKDIIPILATALPAVFYIGWSRFTLPTVRFTDADKFKHIRLERWNRGTALFMVGCLLIPVSGLDGVKAVLLLVSIFTLEHQLMVPFMTPLTGEKVAAEIAFLIAVSLVFMLHLVFLHFDGIDVDRVWWYNQLCKVVSSFKLALHEPHLLSMISYFAIDWIEMTSSSKKYGLDITDLQYALVLVGHLCAFAIGMIGLFVIDLMQQNKKLKENNTTLAMHCNLPTQSEDISTASTPTPSVHEDEEIEYPSDNSHHGSNIFRPPSPNNSEVSSSGGTSVPPLRMHGARRQLEQMTLERLTNKIQKLSRKVDEICAGEDVSSESTTSTMNSQEKVTALKMELNVTRQKMTDMMEVMNNRDMGAIEAMIELQRQTGIAPTIAVGVPCPSGHSGRADVIV